MAQINKGQEGEDIVNEIAYRSFLNTFCFPNPLDISKDYKEICDLLILFHDICIIISVKNYSFEGNYDRYFRKTTEKSIKQILGAERRLFRDSPHVLIKHPDRNEIIFDKSIYKKVYRIIININQEIKFFQTSIQKDNKEFTVFDYQGWKDAIEILDTIPDFIQFLEKRAQLFVKNPVIIFPREENDFGQNDKDFASIIIKEIAQSSPVHMLLGTEKDLIAEYIIHGYEFPSRLKILNTNCLLLKLDGRWDSLHKSGGLYILKMSRQESYIIDNMVKEMVINKSGGEFLSEMLYKMDRSERQSLAQMFLKYCDEQGNIFNQSLEKIEFNRTICKMGSHYIIFMYFDDKTEKEKIELFMKMSMRQANYLENFTLDNVGGIAISHSKNTYYFGYYHAKSDKLSSEEIADFEKDIADLGWKTKN